MNIFKIKKHKFCIKKKNRFVSIEEIFVPALGGPYWFKKLCPFIGKHKTELEMYTKTREMISRTAKTCPGMLELFKNSFLLKFPCDVILETKDTGEYLWQKPTQADVLTITAHSEAQVESSGPPASSIIIKFSAPFLFQALDNKVALLDPFYWKIQPYKVAPGIIDFKKSRYALPLNVIVLFEKKNKIYYFKKGEPMCLYYTFNQCVLEKNENLLPFPKRLSFSFNNWKI